MKFQRKLIIITLTFFVNYLIISPVAAEVGFGFYQPTNQATADREAVYLNIQDLGQNLTKGFFNGALELAWTDKFLAAPGQLTAGQSDNWSPLPWNLKKISPIYEFSFAAEMPASPLAPLELKIAYQEPNNYFKQVYYFDREAAVWKALPTTDYPAENLVRAVIKQATATVAVFANSSVPTVGQASWYAYQGGLFAASPDFPKGSRLRVTNLNNGQALEVTVNDWGPDRAKHPERVIDLDKEAFRQLAPLGAGVIKVSVSPINLSPDRDGRVLGVKAEGVTDQPTLNAKSAIIISEATGQVIFDKNSEAAWPLASLTKMIAMKVFLDRQPDLEQVVVYKKADEKLNYAACHCQSSKINLKDGDKVKIRDLLYAALVGSANNAVETLVRTSGLARADFIAKMNEQAKNWGAVKTHFVEPTGLSTANTSSAKDYALLMKEVLSNEVIAQASVEPSYVFFTVNKKKRYVVKNTNKLLTDQAQPNLRVAKLAINGSKTGYLVEAGYCLMTRVKSGVDNFIIVTLGEPTREKSFNEMFDLIKYLQTTT